VKIKIGESLGSNAGRELARVAITRSEIGPDRREEDVPRLETRLGQLQAARASLEAQAREKARVKAEQSERRGAQRRDESPDEQRIADVGQAAADPARPEATAQRNFTDPDSRIMKNRDGAFIQAYNGQAVVDDTDQIVLGVERR
jgi:hypothetical protein